MWQHSAGGSSSRNNVNIRRQRTNMMLSQQRPSSPPYTTTKISTSIYAGIKKVASRWQEKISWHPKRKSPQDDKRKYPGIQSERVTVKHAIRGLHTQTIIADHCTSLLMHRPATMKYLKKMILTIMNEVDITTTTTNKNNTQTNSNIEPWCEFYGYQNSSCRDLRYYRMQHRDTRITYGESRRGRPRIHTTSQKQSRCKRGALAHAAENRQEPRRRTWTTA